MNVVVITGASGTIGAAIARRFVTRGDCRVIGTARNIDALGLLRSSAFHPVAVDVMTGEGLEQLVTAIGDDRVSMFVSAVGSDLDIPSGEVDVFGVTESLLRHEVELKIHGFLRVLHAIKDHFESGAAIVGIGGNLGAEPLGDTGGVGAVDAALSNLVRQMSKSAYASTYSFHVVAPGPVRSPRIEKVIDSAEAHAKASGQPFDRATTSSALRQIDADDVSWLIETLYAGPAARMSGGTLTIDNGLRMGMP